MNKKNPIQWYPNGTFSFAKGSRPLWTTEAKKISLAQGEDRRHGLHGAEVITKACEAFINNELKRSGAKKTSKKLRVNLKSRLLKDLEQKSLDELINIFRRYAFSKVSNLLPGDGEYNKAIEATRKVMVTTKRQLHVKFFGQGQMPSEIAFSTYQAHALALLRKRTKRPTGNISKIVQDILLSVAIPSVQQCSTLRGVDEALIAIIDTTKIDIGFSSTKFFRRYNKRVLALDTRIKRAMVAEEGLTQELFNKLIGYRPRRKKNK